MVGHADRQRQWCEAVTATNALWKQAEPVDGEIRRRCFVVAHTELTCVRGRFGTGVISLNQRRTYNSSSALVRLVEHIVLMGHDLPACDACFPNQDSKTNKRTQKVAELLTVYQVRGTCLPGMCATAGYNQATSPKRLFTTGCRAVYR